MHLATGEMTSQVLLANSPYRADVSDWLEAFAASGNRWNGGGCANDIVHDTRQVASVSSTRLFAQHPDRGTPGPGRCTFARRIVRRL